MIFSLIKTGEEKSGVVVAVVDVAPGVCSFCGVEVEEVADTVFEGTIGDETLAGGVGRLNDAPTTGPLFTARFCVMANVWVE